MKRQSDMSDCREGGIVMKDSLKEARHAVEINQLRKEVQQSSKASTAHKYAANERAIQKNGKRIK